MENILSIIWAMFTIIIIAIPLAFAMGISGHLVIEKSYFNEYSQAQEELFQCKQEVKNTVPICPKVEVKPNTQGYIFTFIGLLFYIGSLYQWTKANNKLDEVQKLRAELTTGSQKPVEKKR
jgi:hypothetical protein